MRYDYRHSSVSDDRAAAEKVEARAFERQQGANQDQDQPNKDQDGHHSNGDEQEDDDGQDAAARRLQKNYR